MHVDDDLEEAERGAARLFQAAMVAGPQDEALDRAVVERALARIVDRPTVGQRVRRFFTTTKGVVTIGAATMITLGLVGYQAGRPIATRPQPPAPARLVLNDGSDISSDGAAPAVDVTEQTPGRTMVRLRSGSARFRVRHDPARLFRVDAGPVEIEDLGTIFRVDRQPGERVRVAVAEGRVAVLYPAAHSRVELQAGEERTFGPVSDELDLRAPSALALPAPPTTAPPAATAGPAKQHMSDRAASLLAAADLARRSGRPEAAVVPLRRLLQTHPADPRAPAAAFTLGWLLMTDLGRPREAAAAFTKAEQIAPAGTLAEDAAVRIAEAWQKAGDPRRAREAALRYERAYPAGRYLSVVRGLAGQR